jgi:molybdenum cofactor cytidylyltransferase
MRWGIIVLAAGISSRMDRPKMTLSWDGTTVLGRALETLAEAMGDRGPAAVVVTGGDEEAVRAEVSRVAGRLAARVATPLAERLAARMSVACAPNPDFRNGEMIDSLRAGLANLPSEAEIALVALGDQPQLSVEAARAVIEAAERSASPILVPVHEGRRGHPWAVARPLWDELRRARTARDFLEARRAEVAECASDETVLKDLDTPEDYERESRRLGLKADGAP